ncbi:hypothetical protein BCR41DRAFT_353456 [Lobosporangium transversale]|uniref:Secreted protein n=1 Tax=Lobosporangium transversale TaxID=64571 RepID=A0A1Y2GMS0_9FUNG|nr:hypothetical protein BCR41DRAFT_353456 [Lobosporangium transversale]ORZ16059.1 hypothetical protein BCR41DRAFT_353456 [Lobosporangium transversale]|eukprot:XP_021881406.1 hypothetical protein BCR41DRAFT_353456 [Lobosporangium transversale]
MSFFCFVLFCLSICLSETEPSREDQPGAARSWPHLGLVIVVVVGFTEATTARSIFLSLHRKKNNERNDIQHPANKSPSLKEP